MSGKVKDLNVKALKAAGMSDEQIALITGQGPVPAAPAAPAAPKVYEAVPVAVKIVLSDGREILAPQSKPPKIADTGRLGVWAGGSVLIGSHKWQIGCNVTLIAGQVKGPEGKNVELDPKSPEYRKRIAAYCDPETGER